nr:Ribosome-binding factor A [uncultured bacterium]
MKLFKSEKTQQPKSANRQLRLCQEVQRFVSELITRKVLPPVDIDGVMVTADPLMTIARADVSPDMKTAKIYVRHFDDNQLPASLKYLEAVKSVMRHAMAKQLNMRFTPELSFHVDALVEKERRMDELFSKTARSVVPDLIGDL